MGLFFKTEVHKKIEAEQRRMQEQQIDSYKKFEQSTKKKLNLLRETKVSSTAGNNSSLAFLLGQDVYDRDRRSYSISQARKNSNASIFLPKADELRNLQA